MSQVVVRTPAESQDLLDLATAQDILCVTDASDLVRLTRVIQAASRAVLDYTQRSFAREAVTERIGVGEIDVPSGGGPFRIMVSRTPVLIVEAIRFNGVALDLSTLEVEDPNAGFLYRPEGFASTQIFGAGIEPVRTRFSEPLWEIDYSAGYIPATFPAISLSVQSSAIDATTDTITAANHGLVVGDTVKFTPDAGAALPAPLSPGRHYLVRDVTANSFRLADQPGSRLLDLTDQGTGGMTIQRVTTLPSSIDNAVLSLVVSWWQSQDRDQAIKAERLGDHAVTFAGPDELAMSGGLPGAVAAQLMPWRCLV